MGSQMPGKKKGHQHTILGMYDRACLGRVPPCLPGSHPSCAPPPASYENPKFCALLSSLGSFNVPPWQPTL